MCILVDDNNIFVHVPKCAGTSVSRMINSKNIKNKNLCNLNEKLRVGHFGVYPLIINNLYNNITPHLIFRDPVEWYVSQYLYVKDNPDHPYYIYAKPGFKHFFQNLIDMKNDKVAINNHLRNHVNRKINNKPLFCKYKLYNEILTDAKNKIYINNHPDLNILLSDRNISEGLYTYFYLFLISKINPLILFSKDKEDIIKNIDKYLANVKIYDIDKIENLLKNIGFENTGVFANKSKKRTKSYLSYYDDEMLKKIKEHHKLLYIIYNKFKVE